MRLKPNLFFLVLILLAIGLASFYLFSEPTVTQTGTSAEARFNSAREQGKPLLVFFTSEFCPQCKEVRERIAQVDPVYFQKVDFLEVDIHLPENRRVVRAAGVISVPSLVFYDKKGNRQVFLGVIDVKDLDARLEALAETGSFYVKK